MTDLFIYLRALADCGSARAAAAAAPRSKLKPAQAASTLSYARGAGAPRACCAGVCVPWPRDPRVLLRPLARRCAAAHCSSWAPPAAVAANSVQPLLPLFAWRPGPCVSALKQPGQSSPGAPRQPSPRTGTMSSPSRRREQDLMKLCVGPVAGAQRCTNEQGRAFVGAERRHAAPRADSDPRTTDRVPVCCLWRGHCGAAVRRCELWRVLTGSSSPEPTLHAPPPAE